ncbi:Alpha/beta hydrolase fold-3 [Dillenia turbinata]|uniref:Alpha/beta hydrolase fold-3 n=1 Tax=Dillenia turbinata TaxID=194707 RepID=A0AAN8ZDH0_9MAGN
MPSVAVKLYGVYFKLLTRHRLRIRLNSSSDELKLNSFGITSRPNEEQIAASNPSFVDCVATKDLHIDPFSSLSLRVFLPNSCLCNPNPESRNMVSSTSIDDSNDHLTGEDSEVYGGYLPAIKMDNRQFRKLPVVLQFHGGGFVSGSNDSVANDLFCRRIAKLCDVIVIAVGYRLAPESKYPAAFEDGLKVLNWLAKQANLAECGKSSRRLINHHQQHIFDSFGAALAEPWLAAHADPSRCVLLGVSCGANIAEYVVRKAVEAGKLLDPVKVVAQVLMYPFFMGSVPTHSETKLANSYFYDKSTCMLAWKLFLPEEEFDLDHPAANPLNRGRETPFKYMPPTLTVVAEHDWMRDRAIAYSEELRKFNIDAPVLEYKDAVHEFATLDILLKTPQALACAEDIAIWVKKYISLRGHEFSY